MFKQPGPGTQQELFPPASSMEITTPSLDEMHDHLLETFKTQLIETAHNHPEELLSIEEATDPKMWEQYCVRAYSNYVKQYGNQAPGLQNFESFRGFMTCPTKKDLQETYLQIQEIDTEPVDFEADAQRRQQFYDNQLTRTGRDEF